MLTACQAHNEHLRRLTAAAYQELNHYKSNHFAVTMATAVSAPAVALPGPPPTIPGTGPVTPGESYQSSFEGTTTQPDGNVLNLQGAQMGYLDFPGLGSLNSYSL